MTMIFKYTILILYLQKYDITITFSVLPVILFNNISYCLYLYANFRLINLQKI